MKDNNIQSPDDFLPVNPVHVHLLGICGVGMVGLARLFMSLGAHVTGSDQAFYPPMSDLLSDMGVQIMEGYKPENLSQRPDLAVVGNVIRSVNPEAKELSHQGIPHTSMAGALRNYFLKDKISVVVTGTHGKTTLTSMIAWILYDQGLDPSFFVGGIPTNFGCNSRLGQGQLFVIEGDEYDTAYFDKTPKFLHYMAKVVVLTSIEFDHADIYNDIDQIKSQFVKLLSSVPSDGAVVACSDYKSVLDVIGAAKCAVHSYGSGNDSEWSFQALREQGAGLTIEIMAKGAQLITGTLPILGAHNALNALAAIATASRLGVAPDRAMNSLSKFLGVQRRQQIYGHTSGITVIDDFAHHPTAVRLTCDAIKSRYPDKRVIAVFEPRTNTSRRSVFQKDYATSFVGADLVILREPPTGKNDNPLDLFDSGKLADDLGLAGQKAVAFRNADQILDYLMDILQTGDIVLLMSNGNFEGLRSRLLKKLDEVVR